MNHIETERLILRDWEPQDLKPLTAINQDPKVLEFLPGALSEEETANMIQRFQLTQQKHGFTLFACELKDAPQLIGFVGLSVPPFEINSLPCVEIGWRLGSAYWGRGYATEAAQAVLEKGFTDYGLKEIVSFTVPDNLRSRRVMEKIGLSHDVDGDFQHPFLPKAHRLSWHVLYRLGREQLR